jgi:hypothetical protein
VRVPDSLFVPNPKVAVRRSLIFPGLGQIYNRSYWKLAFVYGGLGTVTGFALYNQGLYRRFDRDYQATVTDTNLRGDDNLRAVRDNYRRNRDFMIILGILGYGLTAVEAYVDAHLKNFDVSPNLGVLQLPAYAPSPLAMGGLRPVPALGLTFTLR